MDRISHDNPHHPHGREVQLGNIPNNGTSGTVGIGDKNSILFIIALEQYLLYPVK